MSIITYSVATHSRLAGCRYQPESVPKSNRASPVAVYEYSCNRWAFRHNRHKIYSSGMKEIE